MLYGKVKAVVQTELFDRPVGQQVLPDGYQQVARTGGIDGHALNGISRLEENPVVEPAEMRCDKGPCFGGCAEGSAVQVGGVEYLPACQKTDRIRYLPHPPVYMGQISAGDPAGIFQAAKQIRQKRRTGDFKLIFIFECFDRESSRVTVFPELIAQTPMPPFAYRGPGIFRMHLYFPRIYQ